MHVSLVQLTGNLTVACVQAYTSGPWGGNAALKAAVIQVNNSSQLELQGTRDKNQLHPNVSTCSLEFALKL